MSKLEKSVSEMKEGIAANENEIHKRENLLKEVRQMKTVLLERTDKTCRVIRRGSILESFFNEADKLATEHIERLLYSPLIDWNNYRIESEYEAEPINEIDD